MRVKGMSHHISQQPWVYPWIDFCWISSVARIRCERGAAPGRDAEGIPLHSRQAGCDHHSSVCRMLSGFCLFFDPFKVFRWVQGGPPPKTIFCAFRTAVVADLARFQSDFFY